MTNILSTFGNRVIAVFEKAGRERARMELLRLDPSLIERSGMSRELLHEGIGEWPWHSSEKSAALAAAKLKRQQAKERQRGVKQAIRELQAMSDRELADLAISRGEIKRVVRTGRRDIDTLEPIQFDKVA